MNIRRKVILAVAMSFVMVVTVGISVVAVSLAWQEWEKGQWEMAGIFAVAAAVFLSATFVLGYQMLSTLRRKRSQHMNATLPPSTSDGGLLEA